MKFFPIVPIRYLSPLASLSSNQMVLAQWLTEKRYLNFYRKRREKGNFILLDNGACELGKSIPVVELMDWYEKLGGCNVLVIPDTAAGNNLELARKSINYIYSFLQQRNQASGESLGNRQLFATGLELMGVPQSLHDLDEMVKISEIAIIGLNRTIAQDLGFGGREGIIAKYRDCGKRFHLLGIRINPIDEILAVKPFGDLVLGIDSSFPYRLFSRGRRIEEHRPYPSHNSMYQKDLSGEILSFCIGEFKCFLEWINE